MCVIRSLLIHDIVVGCCNSLWVSCLCGLCVSLFHYLVWICLIHAKVKPFRSSPAPCYFLRPQTICYGVSDQVIPDVDSDSRLGFREIEKPPRRAPRAFLAFVSLFLTDRCPCSEMLIFAPSISRLRRFVFYNGCSNSFWIFWHPLLVMIFTFPLYAYVSRVRDCVVIAQFLRYLYRCVMLDNDVRVVTKYDFVAP